MLTFVCWNEIYFGLGDMNRGNKRKRSKPAFQLQYPCSNRPIETRIMYVVLMYGSNTHLFYPQ